MCQARVVAEMTGRVTVVRLRPARDAIYGWTAQDTIFRAARADAGWRQVEVLATDRWSKDDVVARDGRVVWLSGSEVHSLGDGDGGEGTLAVGIESMAPGVKSLYLLTHRGTLWARDWAALTTPHLVAAIGKRGLQIVVAEPWVVGVGLTDGVWAYNLETQAMATIPQCPDDICQFKPGGLSLSTERNRVTWSEGNHDILPGPAPRTFVATMANAAPWTVTLLAKDDPPPEFVLDGSCMFAGGKVKGVSQDRWTDVGIGFTGEPVADDGSEWLWVSQQDNNPEEQIFAAPKAPCCELALAGAAR